MRIKTCLKFESSHYRSCNGVEAFVAEKGAMGQWSLVNALLLVHASIYLSPRRGDVRPAAGETNLLIIIASKTNHQKKIQSDGS